MFLKMEITGGDESSKNSGFICGMISDALNMLLLLFCEFIGKKNVPEHESYAFLSCFGGKLSIPLPTLAMELPLIVLSSALSLIQAIPSIFTMQSHT